MTAPAPVEGEPVRTGSMRWFCTPAAERRGDDMVGTAAPAARWLLVEQPGGWGRNALLESQLDRTVARQLSTRAAAVGARVLLVRRPGRQVSGEARRWAYVDSRPGREGTIWGSYAADADLLDIPLDRTGGRLSAGPAYLVCAHGRHDVCCAVRGRPVAGALLALRPEATWECSHVGGDRFAANVIVLPHGLYYGRVPATAVPELVGAYERGDVLPELLRGRSALPAAAQAAQHHARLALGERGLDALAPLETRKLDGHGWQVRLAHPSGRVTVTLRAETTSTPELLTCASTRPELARFFTLVALDAPGHGG